MGVHLEQAPPRPFVRCGANKELLSHTAARHVDGVSVYAQYMEEAEGVHRGVERGQDAARLLRVQRPQDFILLRQVCVELSKCSLAPGQVVDRPNDVVHVRWRGCGGRGAARMTRRARGEGV